MSRIDELIAALCPEGVGFKTLGELLDYEQPGKYLVASTAYDNSYGTPVLTAGQTFILGYTDETSGIYAASPQEPVIIFDDFTTAFKWVDFPFKAKSSAMKMLTLKAGALDSLKYVFFAMQMIAYTPQDHARQWIGTYSKFLIPVPPLEVQRQIVKVLDTFTTLEARRALLTFEEGTDASTRVRWVTLGEICQINRGRVMSKDYLRDNVGSYPVYSSQTANDGVFGFIDTFDYDFESITWTTDGANAGSLFYHCDKKFSITNVCGLLRVIDSSQINTKFLYYALGQVTKRHVSDGMGNPKLMGKVMSQIKVAIPPLEVQRQIVKVLDTFTTLEAELEAELEARRRQYQYYRDALLRFGGSTEASGHGEDGAEKNQWKPTGINRIDELIAALCPEGVGFKCLGNVTRIRNGKDHKLLNDGHIPVYGSGGIMRYVDTYAYDKPSVLIPRKGSLGNLFYVDVPFWNVDTIFYTEVDESQVLPKFLYYFLTTVGLGEMNQAGGVPSQTQSVLNNLKIPIPPLEVQARIVAVLDQFDTLVNDITAGLPAEIAARRQQYAYYRDRLLTFKEAV